MSDKQAIDGRVSRAAELRRRAEESIRTGGVRPALAVSETDAGALVHELQVRQIELEMQDEELERARAAAQKFSAANQTLQAEIAARKRAEKSLRESRERLSLHVENTPLAVIEWESDFRISRWSAEAQRIFGWRADEVLGKQLDELRWVHDSDFGQVVDMLVELIDGTCPHNVSCNRNCRKDGSIVYCEWYNSSLLDESGQLRSILSLVLDVTDRKRAEEELKNAKKAAETANEAKSRFLANVSHDLRTPISAIMGMIDMALTKAVDPTINDCLRTAKGSASLLLTLLNALLDSAKIESGKLELESAPFSLRQTLGQITRILSVQANEKGLRFSCRLPDATPDALVGDQTRLQQILLNLAGNSIKFTERGDVEISVRVAGEEEGLGIGDWGLEEARQPGTPDPRPSLATSSPIPALQSLIPNPQSLPSSVALEFAVRDTGIGIPPSVQQRLFQPFIQADASTTRRFGGTGLGLSICKSLVEMMGGRIWIESEPGLGTTFCFTVRLPLAQQPPSESETPAVVAATPCSPLRILLVEDNPANQMVANYVLLGRGHVVEIAENGPDAVRLAGQTRYDVILMDLQLAEMDGMEATAAIRKCEDGGNRVPIIAMTAHAMESDRQRCLAAGMDSYLSKPFNAQAMIALVESLARDASPVA